MDGQGLPRLKGRTEIRAGRRALRERRIRKRRWIDHGVSARHHLGICRIQMAALGKGRTKMDGVL
jgi:hypothetical protein